MRVSRLEKIKLLEQSNRLSGSHQAGLHRTIVGDGLLHELAHAVCQGVRIEDLRQVRDWWEQDPGGRQYRPDWLEDLVRDTLDDYHFNGGNSDADECRAIAVCVQALRQLGCMRDTERYVDRCLETADVEDADRARDLVYRSLETKVAKQRAVKVLKFVDQLYDDEITEKLFASP